MSSQPNNLLVTCKILVVILSAICLVSASDFSDFSLGSVRLHGQTRSRFYISVNYTAPSKPKVYAVGTFRGQSRRLSARHSFDGTTGELRYSARTRYTPISVNINFILPDNYTSYNVSLNPITVTRNGDIQHTEAIPNLRFQPQGDVTYPADEASVDVRVESDDAIEEGMEFELYLRDDLALREHGGFSYSKDWPLSLNKQSTPESGTVYTFQFNSSVPNPTGVLMLRPYKVFSSGEDGRLVKSVRLVTRVQIYPAGRPQPLNADTFGFVYSWGEQVMHEQTCDLNLSPTCTAACNVVGTGLQSLRLQDGSDFWDVRNSELSTELGFLTVRSAPVTYPTLSDQHSYYCVAKKGDTYIEQMLVVNIRRSARIDTDHSSAAIFPNQTLAVKCSAKGKPIPTITITDPDHPSTSLQDRFPDQSSWRQSEGFGQVTVVYTLTQSSFTGTLSQVLCSADNGVQAIDQVVLDVQQNTDN